MVESAEIEDVFEKFCSTTSKFIQKDRLAVTLEIFANFQPCTHANINHIVIMSKLYWSNKFLLVKSKYIFCY